ncbi:MAG: FKBP-type peptidyl-prolyl cis-trans isomerase [Candidatus Nanopelagicales bacterium]|nr:FKBP-type peptidyl-prolyl cis-trans isomerase [Candidatus Nanopelagicales bacterium]
MFKRSAVLAVSALLVLTGCSSAAEEAAPSDAPNNAPVSVEVSGDSGTQPVVVITPGAPVTQLEVTDVIVGSGDAVPAGATVTADYVGYGAATGEMFDASWVRGEPATFPLANVILGWQEGLVGMQVGGRRLLVIPAELGYGDNPPQGSGIEAGETLIFVVDLVSFE